MIDKIEQDKICKHLAFFTAIVAPSYPLLLSDSCLKVSSVGSGLKPQSVYSIGMCLHEKMIQNFVDLIIFSTSSRLSKIKSGQK